MSAGGTGGTQPPRRPIIGPRTNDDFRELERRYADHKYIDLKPHQERRNGQDRREKPRIPTTLAIMADAVLKTTERGDVIGTADLGETLARLVLEASNDA
jgi:hypothetical protein